MGTLRISQRTLRKQCFYKQNKSTQEGKANLAAWWGDTLSSIPSLLPLSRMWGSSSYSSFLAPALKIIRLLTDPLQLHSRRKHEFFSCLVNKMCKHPGKCGKQQSWLGARGQSTHPGPCDVSRVPGCSPRASSGNGSERAREEQSGEIATSPWVSNFHPNPSLTSSADEHSGLCLWSFSLFLPLSGLVPTCCTVGKGKR